MKKSRGLSASPRSNKGKLNKHGSGHGSSHSNNSGTKVPMLSVHLSKSFEMHQDFEDKSETSQVTFDYSLASSMASDRTSSVTFMQRYDYGFGKYMSGSEHSLDSSRRRSCLKRTACPTPVDFLTPAAELTKDDPVAVKPLYSDDEDEDEECASKEESFNEESLSFLEELEDAEDDDDHEDKGDRRQDRFRLKKEGRPAKRELFRRNSSDYSFAIDSFSSIPEDAVLPDFQYTKTVDSQGLQNTLDKQREHIRSLYDDDSCASSKNSNANNSNKELDLGDEPTPKLYDDESSCDNASDISPPQRPSAPESFSPPQSLHKEITLVPTTTNTADRSCSSSCGGEAESMAPSLVELSPLELKKQLLDSQRYERSSLLQESPTPESQLQQDIVLPALLAVRKAAPVAPYPEFKVLQDRDEKQESATLDTSDSTAWSGSSISDSGSSVNSSPRSSISKASFSYPTPMAAKDGAYCSSTASLPSSPPFHPSSLDKEFHSGRDDSSRASRRSCASLPTSSPSAKLLPPIMKAQEIVRSSYKQTKKEHKPPRPLKDELNPPLSCTTTKRKEHHMPPRPLKDLADSVLAEEDLSDSKEDSDLSNAATPRQLERAARLAKAKERIRLEKLEQERQQALLEQQTQLARRMEAAYQWYTRCGYPSKTEFHSCVQTMDASCGISQSDVDLLPWSEGGSRVDPVKVKACLKLCL